MTKDNEHSQCGGYYVFGIRDPRTGEYHTFHFDTEWERANAVPRIERALYGRREEDDNQIGTSDVPQSRQ